MQYIKSLILAISMAFFFSASAFAIEWSEAPVVEAAQLPDSEGYVSKKWAYFRLVLPDGTKVKVRVRRAHTHSGVILEGKVVKKK